MANILILGGGRGEKLLRRKSAAFGFLHAERRLRFIVNHYLNCGSGSFGVAGKNQRLRLPNSFLILRNIAPVKSLSGTRFLQHFRLFHKFK